MVVAPVVAYPIANPAIPYSHKGVLNTRSDPYFSFKPTEHQNTPPNFTSSPKRTADGSFFIAISNALLIAVHRFIFVF